MIVIVLCRTFRFEKKEEDPLRSEENARVHTSYRTNLSTQYTGNNGEHNTAISSYSVITIFHVQVLALCVYYDVKIYIKVTK